MAYDDLMGLDMYDDGMEGFYSAAMLRDQVIAAGASGAGILLASWVLPKLTKMEMLSKYEEPTRHRIGAVVGILGGMLGGRLLWDYNRDAAMAVVGGVSGLGLAQLVDSFFKERNLLGGGTAKMYPLGSFMEMPEEDTLSAGDQALLAAYGSDSGSALAALESTNVSASRGAFGGFAGTVVNQEQLMGFGGLDAAVVAGETLGEGYNPYLA
jgi:hypothetical protein